MNEDSAEDRSSAIRLPQTRSFRKWQPSLMLTPEQVKRQSAVLRSASQALLSRDRTVAFLNSYNQHLDGVPLQLALASDEGLLGVERRLVEMKAREAARSESPR